MATKRALCIGTLLSTLLLAFLFAWATPAWAAGGAATIGDAECATLGDAIEAAQDGDTITLQKNVKGYFPIAGKSLTLDLNGLTVTAAESGTIYNSNDLLRAFDISGGNVTIKNGTITGANSTGSQWVNRIYTYWGGAVSAYSGATVTLEDLTLTGNQGTVVEADNSTLNINNCKIVDNNGESTLSKSNTDPRGMVHTYNKATLTMTNTEVSGMSGKNGMAPFYLQGGAASLTGCDIKNNTAYMAGGIYFTPGVSGAKLTLNDTTVKENTGTSNTYGIGGLYLNAGTLELVNSAIYNNSTIGTSMYAADILLSGVSIAVSPAEEMVDHGTRLDGYVYKNGVDCKSYDNGIPAVSHNYKTDQFDVVKAEGADGAWQYGSATYRTLTQAADAYAANSGADGQITLLMDVTESDVLVALGTEDAPATIDLGGHTVSSVKSTMSTIAFGGLTFATIQNGTVAGGKNGVEFRTAGSNITAKDVTFKDNSYSGIVSGYSYKSAETYLYIDSCTFEGNGFGATTGTGTYATYCLGNIEVRNSTFKDGKGGVSCRAAIEPVLEGLTFEGNTGSCISIQGNTSAAPFTASSMTVKDCVFKNNQLSGGDMIAFNAKQKTVNFDNCQIVGNVGATKTVYISNSTTANFKNCLISGNIGQHQATSYVVAGITGYIATINLIDTVVKDNTVDTTYKSNSSFNYISTGGIYCNQKLTITGSSAVYHNTAASSATPDLVANDIFLPGNTNVTIPAAKDMIDGGFDFSRYVWEDHTETDPIRTAISRTPSHKTMLTAIVAPEEVNVAQIGEVKYHTLEEAFAAAQDGDFIEIIIAQDRPSVRTITPEHIDVTKKVALDLNGIKLEGIRKGDSLATLFTVKEGAELSVKDSASDEGDIWKYKNLQFDSDKIGSVQDRVVVEEGAALHVQSSIFIGEVEHHGDGLSFAKPLTSVKVQLDEGRSVELGSAWEDFTEATTLEAKLVITLDDGVLAALNDPDVDMDDVVVAHGGGPNIKNYIKVEGITAGNVRKVYVEKDGIEMLVLRKDLVGVYLDGVDGKPIADGADGTIDNPVKTFEEAHQLLLEQPKAEGIIVKNVVTVDAAAHWDLADCGARGKMIRWNDYNGNLALVSGTGALTLTNMVFDGQGDDGIVAGAGKNAGDGSLVYVEPEGKLVVSSGAVLQNNYLQLKNGYTSCGGGIYSAGELTIEGGSQSTANPLAAGGRRLLAASSTATPGGIVARNRAVQGGGIYQVGKQLYNETGYTGKLVMTGGSVENNRALWPTGYERASILPAGGGIELAYGADMCFSGGTVRLNRSNNIGGGISLGTTGDASSTCWAASGTTTLSMYGDAVIDDNFATSEGGGLYVQINTEAYVSEGTISNNQCNAYQQYNSPAEVPGPGQLIIGRNASHGGGGIYVNGASLYYYDKQVLSKSSGYKAYNAGILYLNDAEIAYNESGYGGSAYVFCASGDGKLFEMHGNLIHDNIGQDGVDVMMTTISHESGQRLGSLVDDLTYYVSEYTAGGTPYDWQRVNVDGDKSLAPITSTKQLQNANQRIALHSDLSEETTDLSEEIANAKVHIVGNYSQLYGGGIGSNGSVVNGYEVPKVDVAVEKAWDDEALEDERPDTVQVILQRKAEGEPDSAYEDYKTAIVEDDQGDWKATFRDLPAYKTFAGSMKASEACPDCKNAQDEDSVEWVYRVVEDGTYRPLVEGSTIWTGAAAGEDAEDGKSINDLYTFETEQKADTTRKADPDYTFGDTIPVKNFAITNTLKAGGLQVSKTVTGGGADKAKTFAFTVTLDTKELGDIVLNGEFGDMTFVDNVATFSLKGGETMVAEGLPAGITYMVEEDDYAAEGYTAKSTGATGTIQDEKTAKAAFINDKPGSTEVELDVEKIVKATGVTPDQVFEFAVEPAEGSPAPERLTASVTGSGTASFGTITFDTAGTYTYTVQESVPEQKPAGWTYDEKVYTVTYAVEAEDGMLAAQRSVAVGGKETDAVVFENTYEHGTVAGAAVSVSKTVTGDADLAGGATFEFAMEALTDGAPLPEPATVTIAGQGTASFGEVAFDKPGTYRYAVHEIVPEPEPAGWRYDHTLYLATYEVSDVGGALEAKLSLAVPGEGDADDVAVNGATAAFSNDFRVTPVSAVLPVNKRVAGDGAPQDAAFVFHIRSLTEGAPMPAGGNECSVRGAGSAEFGAITFEAPGHYEYEVAEVPTNAAGWTYDPFVYTVAYDVALDGADLVATPTVAKDGKPAEGNAVVFENSYEQEPGTADGIVVTKVLDAAVAPAQDQTFAFDLVPASSSNPMPASAQVTVDGAGTAAFGTITFDGPGTYEYMVVEARGDAAGYDYDKSVYAVRYEVEEREGEPAEDGTRASQLAVVKTEVLKGSEPATDVSFTNVFAAAPALSVVKVTKETEGANPEEAPTFRFVLTPEDDGSPMPDGTRDGVAVLELQGAGTVASGAIQFDEPGIYAYTLAEVKGESTLVAYDDAIYRVVFEVTEHDGQLYAAQDVTKAGLPVDAAVFTNAYTEPEPVPDPVDEPNPEPTPEPEPEPEPEPTPAVKPTPTPTVVEEEQPVPTAPVDVVLVKYLRDALIHAEEFAFGLYDTAGNLIDTVHTTLGTHVDTEGYTSSVEIAFKDLVFDAPGTYRYTIREHVEGTVEVVEGDENNLKGFEPGFYKGGVRYDDRTYEVVITVTEQDGQLHAVVSYPGSADGVHLYNEYSEEYVEIDGFDSHPNDGLHEPEPEPEPTVEPTVEPQPEPAPVEEEEEEQAEPPAPAEQPKKDSSTPAKATTPAASAPTPAATTPSATPAATTQRATTVKTADEAPVASLAALAGLAAALTLCAVAMRLRRRSER